MKLHIAFLLALLTSISTSLNAQSSSAFKFVALGDMPYNIPSDYQRYERLISAINQTNPSFSIFVGDTKSGSTPCSDEYNQKVKKYFNQFSAPLIYSIGDNEWTDCHRPLAGSYDPIERLESVRETFFNSSKSLGKKQIDLVRQADIDSQFTKYVENSYWLKNKFIFVNLHIPGSNNNYERNESAKAEYQDRNRANISWINHIFSIAKSSDIDGIVLAYQADMFYHPSQATSPESGYRDTLVVLSQKASEFKKPILLIHGDSHRLIIDQPLKTADQKGYLENVIRLEVMGAEQIQAVEIQVNPQSAQPFGFKPIILRENMLNP
jgi:hypothetical protein